MAPSQGASPLHEVPGQEYSCSHNGNTCGTESDCGGQICDGEVLVFVVQLLVRVFLELQHLHIEAKANLWRGRLLAPDQMARGLATLQAPFGIVHWEKKKSSLIILMFQLWTGKRNQ